MQSSAWVVTAAAAASAGARPLPLRRRPPPGLPGWRPPRPPPAHQFAQCWAKRCGSSLGLVAARSATCADDTTATTLHRDTFILSVLRRSRGRCLSGPQAAAGRTESATPHQGLGGPGPKAQTRRPKAVQPSQKAKAAVQVKSRSPGPVNSAGQTGAGDGARFGGERPWEAGVSTKRLLCHHRLRRRLRVSRPHDASLSEVAHASMWPHGYMLAMPVIAHLSGLGAKPRDTRGVCALSRGMRRADDAGRVDHMRACARRLPRPQLSFSDGSCSATASTCSTKIPLACGALDLARPPPAYLEHTSSRSPSHRGHIQHRSTTHPGPSMPLVLGRISPQMLPIKACE